MWQNKQYIIQTCNKQLLQSCGSLKKESFIALSLQGLLQYIVYKLIMECIYGQS